LLTDRNGSRIEEPFDLRPILPNNVICADVPALLNGLQCRDREFRELSGSIIGYVRVILGIKHQHFGTINLGSVVPRVVERTAPKLAPVRV